MSKEQAHYQFADELGGIEILQAHYEKQNFSRHSHEGFTVGIIETGAQRFYRTGGDHIAPSNSIILVNADEIHNGCSASEGGWSYQAIYPTPEQFAEVNQAQGLSDNFAPYFTQAVVQDAALAQLLRNTIHSLNYSSNRLLRESLVYACLSQLMASHGKSVPPQCSLKPASKALILVKQCLDEQPAANVSLSELARLVHLSPCHLAKQFVKRYGMPPHAYQIQARLRQAKQLLRQGQPLLKVALDCGFHDQSHFHRHFKRALGVSPGRYAKEVQL
ncbi:AraC family transcriptional regulator [Agarivorans sp. Z349TD_8]|uniref:AraC family transcriptional regulator n=1 Tax=Agarivorans sp. Z349TD_8 TaxID=3421434 RepID=UPI003D7D4EFA